VGQGREISRNQRTSHRGRDQRQHRLCGWGRMAFVPSRFARPCRHGGGKKLRTVFMHEVDLRDGRGCWKQALCLYSAVRGAGGMFGNGFQAGGAPIPKLDRRDRRLTPGCHRLCAVLRTGSSGHRGTAYAEICPQTFSGLVRKGSRLNKLRIATARQRSAMRHCAGCTNRPEWWMRAQHQ